MQLKIVSSSNNSHSRSNIKCMAMATMVSGNSHQFPQLTHLSSKARSRKRLNRHSANCNRIKCHRSPIDTKSSSNWTSKKMVIKCYINIIINRSMLHLVKLLKRILSARRKRPICCRLSRNYHFRKCTAQTTTISAPSRKQKLPQWARFRKQARISRKWPWKLRVSFPGQIMTATRSGMWLRTWSSWPTSRQARLGVSSILIRCIKRAEWRKFTHWCKRSMTTSWMKHASQPIPW